MAPRTRAAPLGAHGPAQLGRARARVAILLLLARADGLGRYRRVEALREAFLERGLDAPILSRMEGEEGGPAAGFEAGGQDGEHSLEGGELLVYFDADGLEGAPQHPRHGRVLKREVGE